RVINVRAVDGAGALLLLRSIVHLVEAASLIELRVLIRQDLRDGSGQGGLSVVNVANGTNVDVRLSPFETRLCHWVHPRGCQKMCSSYLRPFIVYFALL